MDSVCCESVLWLNGWHSGSIVDLIKTISVRVSKPVRCFGILWTYTRLFQCFDVRKSSAARKHYSEPSCFGSLHLKRFSSIKLFKLKIAIAVQWQQICKYRNLWVTVETFLLDEAIASRAAIGIVTESGRREGVSENEVSSLNTRPILSSATLFTRAKRCNIGILYIF